MRVVRLPTWKEGGGGATGEACSDHRGGGCGRSQWLRAAVTPHYTGLGRCCARALAGQRAYHRVRFRREGCLREHSRSFARSALHRPGSEECGGHGTSSRPRRRYYTGTCAAAALACLYNYYDEWRRLRSSEAAQRRSITRSARTDINDDHEIITIIMRAPDPPTECYVIYIYTHCYYSGQLAIVFVVVVYLPFDYTFSSSRYKRVAVVYAWLLRSSPTIENLSEN